MPVLSYPCSDKMMKLLCFRASIERMDQILLDHGTNVVAHQYNNADRQNVTNDCGETL